MSTLATLQSNIAIYLNRTDLNTQITLALNRAIRHYSRFERSWFSETTATFNTVANQSSYGTADGVPTDILDIDNIELQISSNYNISLTPRTYKWIQEKNIGLTNGLPEDYAYYQQKIYLYLIPNQVYTATVSYLKAYTDLSAGSDSNNFTDNVEDLIEARACWWIYSRILKNKEAADNSKSDELDCLLALQSETSRLIGTGKVRPTKF